MNTQLPGQGPDDPQQRSNQALKKDLLKTAVPVLLVILAAVLALSVLYVLITDVSSVVSDIAEAVAGWFDEASLDPREAHSFENFVRLVLLAAAAIFACSFFRK